MRYQTNDEMRESQRRMDANPPEWVVRMRAEYAEMNAAHAELAKNTVQRTLSN